MNPWDNDDWRVDLEQDEQDPYTQVIMDFVALLLWAVFAIICAGIVYELMHPYINTVIAAWEFKP